MTLAQSFVVRGAALAFFKVRGHRLLAPLTQGCGAILMLHSVSPELRPKFDPNGGLCVTPQFLGDAIGHVRQEGYDIVCLDEVHRRLTQGWSGRPYVAITLDDGYRDNLEHAYPVFVRHAAPFCIYVATAFASGQAELWWYALELAIGAGRPLTLPMSGSDRLYDCSTPQQQMQTWRKLYWWLRSIDEDAARTHVASLCRQAGLDGAAVSERLMGWAEIAQLAADPLCTIGAHTMNHYALAKLDEPSCRHEIMAGKAQLEARLGRSVRHFSYPYGNADAAGAREFAIAKEAGFDTAVTTRKGLIFRKHRHQLTALPRLSLNGGVQDKRMLAVLLGGAPFALMNGLQRVLSLSALRLGDP